MTGYLSECHSHQRREDMENQEQPSHSGQSLWPNHSQGNIQEVTAASVFATSSPQVAYTTQSSFVSSFSHGQFVDGQFQPPTTMYRIGGQSYQIAHTGQDVYQPPHSSYERISPVEEYAEPSTTTDTLQQFQHLPPDGASQMISVPVDSTNLQRASLGYPMQVLLEDRRQSSSPIVNRGMSPDEHIATQSPMSMSQGQDPQLVHSSRLIEVVQAQPGQGYSPIPSPRLSLMTSGSGMSTLQYATQSDGPSSSDGTGLVSAEPTDQETDQAVSSISLALQESVVQTSMKAMRRMESYGNEPDTTQTDSSHPYEKFNSPHDNSQGYIPRGLDDGSQDPNSLGSTINSTTCTAPQPSTSRSMGQLPYLHDGMQDNDLVSSHGRLSATLDTTTGADGHSHHLKDISRDLVLVDDSHSGDVGLDSLEFHHFRRDAPIRKSIRISTTLDGSQKPRAKYVPGPYRTDDLWCEECQQSYSSECPHHKLTLVYDKVVLSRAWASLPPLLQIFRLGETTELGVFAKRTIMPMTQFGPFVAEVVKERMSVTNQGFFLQIDNYKDTNESVYLEATDENKCNWMMFVRPAENYAEQNLVCYQHQQDVFFTVTKEIEGKQELKVWYAAHYAKNIGTKVLYPTEEDIQEMDERENKWPCFDCNRKFRSSAQLQNHLLEHENDGEAAAGSAEDDLSSGEGKGSKKKGFPLKSSILKKKVSKPKHDALLNWKKKKSMFYLSKLKRQQSEASKPMKSLFKKREGEGEGGGNEWVCTHCDLTFDNSNLLNLHTLTHAAEDVGLEEINKLAGVAVFPTDFTGAIDSSSGEVELQLPLQEPEENVGILSLEAETSMECPLCKMSFVSKRELIEHASSHGKTKKKDVATSKPYKCEHCWKSFSVQERLTKHLLVHGDEDTKPLECDYCHKRFMNNSALSCHLKTHSEKKYFECPICRQGFDQIAALKTHTVGHEVNGIYTCPDCQRPFEDYHLIRKHIRAFHSDKKYPCPECPKIFPRPDKLKLHMLRHSDHREYMCESCGRQFKRKDKLKEHMKRMHTAEREARMINRPIRPGGSKKFIPKVSPTDYHRFIYKCHMCLLGFKRRGMLVNHLAKRHPETKIDAVPELNLPILKTQRDYYCAYCEKVYKSSSKRKAHIVKNHPGADLPLSSRKKSIIQEIPGLPNPTYSQAVGSVTTVPHNCTFCHKQYASKAKLLQHQRKKHSGMVPPAQPRRRTGMIGETVLEVKLDKGQYDENDDIQAADLLTQAMSELTQTLTDNNRQQQFADFQLASPRIAPGGATLVQTNVQPGSSTIDISHLGQALVHAAHYQVGQQGQLTSVASNEIQPGQATVVLSTSVPNSNVQTITVPTSALHSLVPRTWTNATQFQTFR